MSEERFPRSNLLVRALLAVALTSTFGCEKPREAEQSAPTVSGAVSEPSVERGLALSDHATFEVRLTADTQHLNGQAMKNELSAELHRFRAGSPQAEIWLLRNTQTTASQAASPPRVEHVRDVSAIVRRGKAGEPNELVFPMGASPEARQRLEQLVALSYQCTDPSQKDQWECRQTDGTGLFRVRYARSGDVLTFHKLKYESEAAERVDLELVSSEGKVTRSGDHLTDIEVKEALRVQGGALGVSSTAHLRRLDAPKSLAELSVEFPASHTVAYVFGAASRESDAERDLRLSQGLTPERALTSLRDASTPNASYQARRSLAALARRKPDTVAAITAAFEGASEALRTQLLQTLGEVTGKESVEFVSSVMRDTNRTTQMRRVAVSVLSGEQLEPTPVVQALLGCLEQPELKTDCALTLGSVAYRIKQLSPDARSRALSALESPTTKLPEHLRWAALGNAGAASIGSLVPRLRSEKNPKVRGDLVWALRRVETEEATNGVRAALRGDTDAGVRRSAARVCGEWSKLRACPELAEASVKDRDPQVRAQALRSIWMRSQTAEDRKALAELAHSIERNDADANVRRFAAQLYENLSSGKNTFGLVTGSPNTAKEKIER